MLSSTSSSKLRIAERHYLKIIAAAVVIAILFMTTLELAWRYLGYLPSVPDNDALWVVRRAKAVQDENVIAIAGSSRLLIGINTGIMEKELPDKRIVQLAMNGSSSIPVFIDLANDERFTGKVICEIQSPWIYSDVSTMEAGPLERIEVYRHHSYVLGPETAMRLFLQKRLSMMRTELSPLKVSRRILARKSQDTVFMRFNGDRSYDIEFQKLRWAAFFARKGPLLDEDRVEAVLNAVKDATAKLRARGGDVVFIRMVSSGEVYENEMINFPREKYWDRFAEIDGLTTIHFRDIPELEHFVCAEGSHLDYVEAEKFTEALMRVLRKSGFLDKKI
ncbi:MAG TPA: hypothetical protein PLN69_05780 [bacterium]|nr:hypothetical protein [bacterium]